MHAVEVDAQDAVPLPVGQVEVLVRGGDSREVHERRDRRQCGLDGVERGADGALVGDVRPRTDGLDTVLLAELGGDLLARGLVEVDDADVPALLCQVCGRRDRSPAGTLRR